MPCLLYTSLAFKIEVTTSLRFNVEHHAGGEGRDRAVLRDRADVELEGARRLGHVVEVPVHPVLGVRGGIIFANKYKYFRLKLIEQ